MKIALRNEGTTGGVYRIVGAKSDVWICTDALRVFFDFPRGNDITLRITKKRTREDAYRVEFTSSGVKVRRSKGRIPYIMQVDGGAFYLLNDVRAYLAKRGIKEGVPYYVALDYETEAKK